MNGRNGIHLPGPQPAGPAMVISTPFNDIQLVALVAAQLLGHQTSKDHAEAVRDAQELVAQAAAQQARLPQRLRELTAAQEGT